MGFWIVNNFILKLSDTKVIQLYKKNCRKIGYPVVIQETVALEEQVWLQLVLLPVVTEED